MPQKPFPGIKTLAKILLVILLIAFGKAVFTDAGNPAAIPTGGCPEVVGNTDLTYDDIQKTTLPYQDF